MKNISFNKIFRWFLIMGFIIFLSFVIYYSKNNPLGHPMSKWTSDVQPSQIHSVKIAGKIIKVDLALTPRAQEQGLSGRKELKENEGMLFVFSRMGKYYFWMKDMNFPIDIFWISDQMKVVYIKKNALPQSYPETFSPKIDAKYVLETNAYFSEKNNLKVGEKVEFLSSQDLQFQLLKR